jgi:hypothetical protein
MKQAVAKVNMSVFGGILKLPDGVQVAAIEQSPHGYVSILLTGDGLPDCFDLRIGRPAPEVQICLKSEHTLVFDGFQNL